MELELVRQYFPDGTNGQIFYQGRLVTYSIELPWKNNLAQVSCIPEGRYELMKRETLRFGSHFQLMNVEGRKAILIHPANHAMQELKGCVAPVLMLAGEGEGSHSREALAKLVTLTRQAFQNGDPVFLIIKSVL